MATALQSNQTHAMDQAIMPCCVPPQVPLQISGVNASDMHGRDLRTKGYAVSPCGCKVDDHDAVLCAPAGGSPNSLRGCRQDARQRRARPGPGGVATPLQGGSPNSLRGHKIVDHDAVLCVPQVPLQISGVGADDTHDRDTHTNGRAASPHGRRAARSRHTADGAHHEVPSPGAALPKKRAAVRAARPKHADGAAPDGKAGPAGATPAATGAAGQGAKRQKSAAVVTAGGKDIVPAPKDATATDRSVVQPTEHGLPLPLAAVGANTAATAGGKAAPETREFLNRKRLTTLLEQFGEYPAKYRLLIWGFLLELPHNQTAFQVLGNRGLHPSYAHLIAESPLRNRALTTRLAQALSQLAHWCPVFASVGFMPNLVFPFVKLHAAGATSGSNESCFEMLATLLMNWTRGWFECFPDPPLGILARLDALLAFHDNDLAIHIRRTCRGGVATVSWSLLQDLMTSVLDQGDWLKLWDHCFTVGPDYLYYFLIAYFIALKPTVSSLDTENKIATFLGKPPTIDVNKVIRSAYQLRLSTPDSLRPATAEWAPLPKTGTYTDFTQYPSAGVQLFTQERRKVVEAEDALARRRRVVADLAIKSK
ncbi:hypothetical protein DUNSADRAFT_11363, partial [Dunaliella salina]